MKFKNYFRVETTQTLATFLLTERNSYLLENPLLQKLALLISENYSIEQIAEKIQPHLLSTSTSDEAGIFATAQVRYALMQLEKQGYLIQNEGTLPSNLTIFCEHLGIDPQQAHIQLQTTKVAVKSFGIDLPIAQFQTILESLHIQVVENADIEIILTDDYLQAGLSAYNQQSLDSSRSWMLVQPLGTVVWIGPIFQPSITGCWQCLAQRLSANRPVEEFIQRQNHNSTPLTPPHAALPTTVQTALNMAATEVFKWIVTSENQRLAGVLVTHDTLSFASQNHVLTKRPQCSACGHQGSGMWPGKPLPILLGHRKKPLLASGGHRLSTPTETLQKYQQHISPITGVVRELLKVDRHANDLMHTYVARHHFSSRFDNLETLHQNIMGRSGGTAATDQQAKCSSFCEAIERYSGVFQGDEIRQIGSYRQMAHQAIHPNTCMNFSPAQYLNREEWNASCSGFLGSFQQVPAPFDEEREIEWTPIWSLTHKEFKYLPTAYCYDGYSTPLPIVAGGEAIDCWADSNGCGAGNTLEEAIMHGLMELVERDCVALWWYNRLSKPKVDLASFNDPYFLALQDYYQTIHREFWILDITSDLNIPTFAAISRRTDRDIEDIIFDFGAHFDPKTAIYRALNGLNKILNAVLAANSDGSTRYALATFPVAINWWQTATIKNQPYLVPNKSISAKSYTDYQQLWSDDLLIDVLACQQIIEQQGMELFVLDQTRPDIGLKVVKVIVPGLCHFWQRLGAQRLYQVPVQLGWLKEPLSEQELNPFPMWM
jgi:oxazoline/thiazoline synthase